LKIRQTVSRRKGMMKRLSKPAMTSKTKEWSLLLLLGMMLASTVQGQQWTRFRGPNGQGISHAKTVPAKWTQKDFNWKVKLPAGGHGSPVIWKDTVFVTCESPEPTGGILLALSVADGRVLWQEQYKLTPYRFHGDNSYATATPVVDADCVYVLWQTKKETILAALDHAGNEIWKRTFSGVHTQFGAGTSPMLYDDLVVFTHEHWENDKQYESTWKALDRKTGQTRWTKKRNSKQESYSTPCVYSPQRGQPQLIFTSEAHGMTGIDPHSGETIWELQPVLPARAISSPVIGGDLLIGTCGKGSAGKQLVAIRPGSKDDSPRPSLAYTCTGKSAPYVPTPLAKDGLLFTFHDQGAVSCLRVDTGEVLWCEKPAGKFYGSPVWVNGSLYCMDRAGAIVVIEAASTYKLQAINTLGEGSQATPAVSEGKMYLRTYSHLISIGG
jgi:outer membrane protein assembly factor BamB